MRESEVTLYGDGTQKRDFTVTDIAEGTVKALGPLGYEVINLGNSRQYSSAADKPNGKSPWHESEPKVSPASESGHACNVGKIGKAARVLGVETQSVTGEGINLTVDWHIANRDWLKDLQVDLSK